MARPFAWSPISSERMAFAGVHTMPLIRARERRDRVQRLLTLLTCFAAVAALQATVRLQVIELGYRLEATTKALNQLELENRELRARAVRAEDAAVLEHNAMQRLGLRPPTAQERLVLR